jgi:hypothetical protein
MTTKQKKSVAAVEKQLTEQLDISFSSLSLDEQDKLSKVLFPETHTDSVSLLGKDRALRPTSIKVSKQVNHLLKPLMDKIAEVSSPDSTENIDAQQLDDNVLQCLFQLAVVLSEFYGEDWADVRDAAKQEGLSLAELEALAYTQQELNTANDFFLLPLRALVRFLQMREIASIKLEGMASMSILRRSLPDGIAASTS